MSWLLEIAGLSLIITVAIFMMGMAVYGIYTVFGWRILLFVTIIYTGVLLGLLWSTG